MMRVRVWLIMGIKITRLGWGIKTTQLGLGNETTWKNHGLG